MIAENQTFTGKRIYIDGGSFFDCTFEDCILVFSGLLGVVMERPKIKNCRWEFSGPARETVGFLTGLYHAGARDLIEATFDEIRRGPGKPN